MSCTEHEPSEDTSEPPPPEESSQPTPIRTRRNWKALGAAVIAVILISLAIGGSIYTQPWSKIKVIVSSEYDGVFIRAKVYIDNELKVGWDVGGGMTIVGVWPVTAGSHTIALDHGTWQVSCSGTTLIFSNYIGPDGIMDFTHSYSVRPLTTKNVYTYIVLPE